MSTDTIDVDHVIDDRDAHVNSVWDNSLPPVATVEPGDVVQFECRDTLDGQVGPDSTAADLATVDSDPVHPLTGPVAVEGAESGDVLVVDLLDLTHHGFGFTGVMPGEYGLGLLHDEFPEPAYHAWDLGGDVARFVYGIEVPVEPFPGVIGVAPAEPGAHGTPPPRRVGGNVDVKQLTEGSRLYLPVEVDGALFSIGDCHGAQGDGEVCGMGIEAPMTVTCRFDVRSDLDLDAPHFETSGPYEPAGGSAAYATTGVAGDLQTAARDAVRGMIDHLEADRGLSRAEAYMLCSAAVDLKISEAVNPNVVVSAFVSQSLFE